MIEWAFRKQFHSLAELDDCEVLRFQFGVELKRDGWT
jgi:hypothetical protein